MGATIDFDKDDREAYKLRDSALWGSFSSSSSLLFKKHISMVPKVILQRNTVNNSVVLLGFPSCRSNNDKF